MANKQDLIAKVAEATELTKKDSAAAVEAVFAAVADYLAAGEKVQLIGFGNFEVRERFFDVLCWICGCLHFYCSREYPCSWTSWKCCLSFGRAHTK
ncbi:nucleoid DNA-binding protein [Streptococcus pneumoniae]|nr:nucleoid DNA-binding protein [Streptococcus pneumoniae]